jgi:PPM family protein phosphatase
MAEPAAPVAAAAAPAIDAAQAQHMGRRDAQQDAFGFSTRSNAAFAAHGGQLVVLADGMGGLRNGLWAASHAVQAFIETYHGKANDEPVAAALQRALVAANAVVHDEAARLDAVDRMGSTLAVAVVHDRALHWLNVGDSRVYVRQGGRLRCLSTDHSVAQMLRERVHGGTLSADEAKAHPLRHALTSYLGRATPPEHAVSAAPVPLQPGACVLLCSDGLTQALGDVQIGALLQGSAQAVCDRLLRAALARDLADQDNITVAVLRVPPADETPDAGQRGPGVGVPPGPGVIARPPRPVQSQQPHPAVGGAAAWRLPARLRLLVARWREPLWWGGAVAALAAVALLWLARAPAPPPSGGSAAGRDAPAIDLLAAPPPGSAVPVAPVPAASRRAGP